MAEMSMSVAEATLYKVWLDEQYQAATGANRELADDYERAAHDWRVKEVSRGLDFLAEWLAHFRGSPDG